jgi:hypothetical protein
MQIIEENVRRNLILDADYDPLTGEGSSIGRQLFELSDLNDKLYLPLSMLNVPWIQELGKCGSMAEYVNKTKSRTEVLYRARDPHSLLESMFINERLDHDFEYWAAMSVKITHKDTFKTTPFILRGAQRYLLFELESMRLAGIPIRIVLLKARQWGGSTLVEFYMMWIQNRHRKNWHMAICAQGDDAAKNIRGMYINAARLYPSEIGTITLKRYEGSSKNQICVESGGIIGVGSVNNPDQFRSYNFAMCHLSEVGVWQDTPKRSAINLITSLKETVPDQPYTIVVEESTAKGLNYFYDSWLKAVEGKTRYKAVFVPWFQIDRCRVNVEDCASVYSSFSDYEKFQWEIGATIEGIAWYRAHKADKGYDDWQMFQENPGTPEEAFQSTGQKVFAPPYINALRLDNCAPEFVGEVFASARMGAKALENIEFAKMVNGNLKIWDMPDPDNKLTNRYVVVVDIGGRTEKADNSVIRVYDRAGMIKGGYIKAVLTWAGHLDQDLLAFKAVQIATMYDNAMFVIESNSLKVEEEGDHFLTILNQIKDFYRNIYVRNNEENVGSEFVPKYGFQTNVKSKGLAINAFNAAARERLKKETGEDDGYYMIEPDKDVCNEASWYETKNNGSQGAIQGKRDDRLMASAIGVHICVNHLPLPELKRQEGVRKSVRVRSESTF